MIANGLPSNARHSMVVVVVLNGPNRACAAGGGAATARLRPTETVSRRSSSLTSTTRPALPGQTRIVESSTPLPALDTRQSVGLVDVWLVPIVWAFALEISPASAQISAARANPSVTCLILR